MLANDTQIGGGFTEGELRAASFWVRHRSAVRGIGYGSLIFLNLLLWGYVIWTALDALVISWPRERQLTREIASNQLVLSTLENDRPQSMASGPVLMFQNTDGRFDVAVDLQNPNPQWWAEFDYHFVLAGEATPVRSGFIMPQSETVLTQLGYLPKNRAGGAAQAQIAVDNIRWHRLDPSQLPTGYEPYLRQRFNVQFENIDHQAALSSGASVSRTSFDVVNRGAFGYWSLDLAVKAYRGEQIVGIHRITLANLQPNETRHVDLDWFDGVPALTRTEIIPIINLLDASVYLPTELFPSSS